MRFLFPVCLLLLAGCYAIQKPMASASFDKGRSLRTAVPLDSVVVYGLDDEVPAVYRRFGKLASQGMVSDTSEASVLRALRVKAAAIGADAVHLTENGEIDFESRTGRTDPVTGMPDTFMDKRYRIEAIAFHRTDRGYQPPDSLQTAD